MQRVSKILEILKANHIKVDKDFSLLTPSTSFQTNEIRIVVEKIVSILEEYNSIGVNSGYNSKLRADILKLTQMGADLMGENALRKVGQYKKEIKKMNNTGKNSKVDFVAPLNQWLDTTKNGLEVLLSSTKHDNQIAVLKKSLQLIDELKAGVENVLDKTSRKAYLCAFEITNEIITYREQVYKGNITSTTLDSLSKCKNKLNEWSKLNKAISLFNPAADQKLLNKMGYGFNERDPFNNLSGNILLDEKILTMEQRINDYKESLQNTHNNEISERIKAAENQKKEVMARSQNAKNELNKGMISMDEYDVILQEGFEDLEAIEEELQELREMNKDIGQENRESSMAILRIETIITKIKNYRNNKDLYNILADNINFDTITTFLEGNLADPEMTENSIKNIEYILETVEIHRQSKTTNYNTLKDTLKRRREERNTTKEQQSQNNGKTQEEIEAEKRKKREEMERKMGMFHPSSNNENTNQENQNNVNNDIKDIINVER